VQEGQVKDDQSVTLPEPSTTETERERDPRAWRKLAAILGVSLVLFSPACTANLDSDDGVETDEDADVDLDEDDVDDDDDIDDTDDDEDADDDLDVEIDEDDD